MKIITDCGGTKGDWCYVADDGQVTVYQTPGINPVHKSSESIDDILGTHLPLPTEAVEEIWYYGAGTGTDDGKNKMSRLLQAYFGCDSVQVETDLLASCRATAQSSMGIVSILGTGSASCLYDGHTIVESIPSLGYIAGDEGAGTAIGKALLQAYFYKEMPIALEEKFKANYTLDRSIVLQGIYRNPEANTYIASFASFAVQEASDDFIIQLVKNAFESFTIRHLKKYKNYASIDCHFVGSIGWLFKNMLTTVLTENGLKPGKIIRKPIDHLVEFHTKS